MAERDINLKFKVTDEGTVILDKISQKLSGVEKNVKGMSSSLALIKWDSIVNFGARVFHAGEQVFDFGKNIASSLNDIKRQAEVLGISTTELQKFQYAAKMSNVSNESLTMGMKGLSTSMKEFESGAGDGYEILNTLGLSALDNAGKMKPLDQMFMEIADEFSRYADGGKKIDYANKLMGKSGMDLVFMLNKGKEGIVGYGDELKKMGGIIDENLINKGGSAGDSIEKIDTQVKAITANLVPAIVKITEFGESAAKYLGPGFKKLAERTFGEEVKGTFFKTVDELIAYSKKMAEVKPELPSIIDSGNIKQAQALMHEWLSGYRIDIDELNDAMSVLGTKSTQGLIVGIKDAEDAVAAITGQFKKGKISVLDYANSIKALTESYKKMAGEDTFGSLNEAMDKYLEKVKQLNEQFPDRGQEYQKALSKAVDEWLKTKEKIEEQSPTYIRANLSKWEEDLREAKGRYDAFVDSIQPVPIQAAGGGGGSGTSGWKTPTMPGMSDYDQLMRKLGDLGGSVLNIPVNYDFTATGMSPKIPLGDALRKLTGEFGSIEDLIRKMEVEISFEGTTLQIKKLEREMEKYNKILITWTQMNTLAMGASANSILRGWSPDERDKLFSLMEDLQGQIDFLKHKQSLDILQGYVGSYQFGTTYVPKTGLALVHEGEKIISKNSRVDVGGVNIYVSGAGDPKKVADEIGRVLKYRLSGSLAEAVKGVR